MSSENENIDFSTILASSVHDIKNSLGLLLALLEDISEATELRSSSKYPQIIQMRHEGGRLNGQLIQMLTLYRMNNSQYSLNVDDNNVYECLEECGLENKDLLDEKGISLEIDCDEDFDWFFDRFLIIGIINTILNNAYKYSKDKIRINASLDNNYLVISVEDNGSGYPDSMFTSDSDEQRQIDFKSGSTGLGLYFADKVAHAHTNKDQSGYISISNQGIDGGARFSIALP
jgi:signal transduction histidine kinase